MKLQSPEAPQASIGEIVMKPLITLVIILLTALQVRAKEEPYFNCYPQWGIDENGREYSGGIICESEDSICYFCAGIGQLDDPVLAYCKDK